MKFTSHPSAKFISRLRRGFAAFVLSSAAGIVVAHADSPSETFGATKTSLFKNTGWSASVTPVGGETGIVDSNSSGVSPAGSAAPIGWNLNTNAGSQVFGDLDITSGASNLVVGIYNTASSSGNINITLQGSTLNSQANTILANSSGTTLTFQNDVSVPTDYAAEAGLLTYTIGGSSGNAANFIQATATSNIIINNVIAGNGALTFLGGGNGSTAGATLELGAGSSNDVTGGNSPNAPTPGNGGTFTSTAAVQTSDQNTFSGGLTIGDTAGTANAGTVKVDGANALPTTGAITVNTNSQLLLNGSATYGGASQTLTLNGSGTGGNSNGALATTSGNSSTWQGSVSLASASAIDVAGSTGQLTLSGAVGGGGQLQSVGTGSLVLSGSNNYSGGTKVGSGTVVAGNSGALGSGAVTVSGGNLKTTVSTVNFGAGLTLSSGSIALNSATFNLASGNNFSLSGGTLDLTAGTPGAIDGSGAGAFSLGSGTLDLGGSTGWNYASTYDILGGFASGSVSGLAITDYDTTDYLASVSNAGVLSFTATPEPSSWILGLGAAALFLVIRRVRRESSSC